MVTLAQLRSESASKRVQRIWGGIVQFANADLSDKHAFEGFIELLARCSHKDRETDWEALAAGYLQQKLRENLPEGAAEVVAEAVETANYFSKLNRMREDAKDGINQQEQLERALLLGSFDELNVCNHYEGLTHFEALKSLAVKYHKDFKGVVTWLCAPTHDELAYAAVQFLQKNLRRTRLMLFHTLPGSDDPSIFYWRSDAYESFMSPICQFIFDRIERYHAGELDLREAVPIRVCERADCGKFILPERSGKRYCSGGCRAQAFQKRAGVDWATYMREYRKDRKKRAKRRRKR